MFHLNARERGAFGVGVVAALLATLTMIALRFVFGVPSLPERLADVFLALLPPQVFAAVLDALGRYAKPLMFAALGLAQLLSGGLLGVAYARSRPGWWSALTIAAGLWALFAVVIFPLVGLGPLASAVPGGPILTLVVLPTSFLVYAAYLVWGARAAAPDDRPWMSELATAEAMGVARRQFITRVGVGIGALVLGIGAWRLGGANPSQAAAIPAVSPQAGGEQLAAATVSDSSAAAAPPPINARPPTAVPEFGPDGISIPPATSGPAMAEGAKQTEDTEGQTHVGPLTVNGLPAPGAPSADPRFQVAGLSPEVTTNKDHYVISKNFLDPSVNLAGWTLTIDGGVDRPLEFSYDQLRSMPQVTNFYTLQCISNEVGGDLIGNARWTGIRLADVIQMAGPQSQVVDVELHAADEYLESVTLERALKSDNLIAFQMNGEVLPEGHGFPARLLVPGIYGMKNVKWLTRISMVPSDVKGYWQGRGWSDSAEYKTSSRIDTPKNGQEVIFGPQSCAGVAFSGERGISRVEVSYDQGASWVAATVKVPLSRFTWVLWVAPWDPTLGGSTLMVRATDGDGAVQTDVRVGTLPDGASGNHHIAVNAV